MAIKFKRKNTFKHHRLTTYNVNVYRHRRVSTFLLTLCIMMFFGGAFFLITHDSEKNFTYTEGVVVKKSSMEQNSNAFSKDSAKFITIKFVIRSGKPVNKKVSVDLESYNVLKEGDVIPIIYHYDPVSRDIEIISYGRYPIGKSQENIATP